MLFAVNENVAPSVIQALRARGHDVLAAKETQAGQSDQSILHRAQAEGRVVVTHDKDFGELAYRFGLPATCGVVLIRLYGASPATDRQIVLSVLESRNDWAGHFTVVKHGRVRMRPLPNATRGPKPK